MYYDTPKTHGTCSSRDYPKTLLFLKFVSPQYELQHGWARKGSRQHFCRAAMEVGEV